MLKWPRTLSGWVTVICGIVGILAMIGGGMWTFHEANAYDEDLRRQAAEVQDLRNYVHEVEEYAAEGIKDATCTALDFRIEELERKKAKGEDWGPSDESYLQKLKRKWRRLCLSESS